MKVRFERDLAKQIRQAYTNAIKSSVFEKSISYFNGYCCVMIDDDKPKRLLIDGYMVTRRRVIGNNEIAIHLNTDDPIGPCCTVANDLNDEFSLRMLTKMILYMRLLNR